MSVRMSVMCYGGIQQNIIVIVCFVKKLQKLLEDDYEEFELLARIC